MELVGDLMQQTMTNAMVDVSVGLKNAAGNRALYLRLVKKFIDREHDVDCRLRACISSQDRDGAIRTVHTLKSSSLTLGALHLGATAARLESLWKDQGPLDGALPDLVELQTCVGSVMSKLQDQNQLFND